MKSTVCSDGNRLPMFFVDLNGCWIWARSQKTTGYGRWAGGYGRGNGSAAHVPIWEAFNGPVPDGLELDHLCRTRLCVNPTHLEAVTPTENKYRGMSFSAINHKKTTCRNGHPFDRIAKNGSRTNRECSICRNAYNKEYERRRSPRHR